MFPPRPSAGGWVLYHWQSHHHRRRQRRGPPRGKQPYSDIGVRLFTPNKKLHRITLLITIITGFLIKVLGVIFIKISKSIHILDTTTCYFIGNLIWPFYP